MHELAEEPQSSHGKGSLCGVFFQMALIPIAMLAERCYSLLGNFVLSCCAIWCPKPFHKLCSL